MSQLTFKHGAPLWAITFKSGSRIELRPRSEIERALIKEARQDEYFKADLLANPRGTIENFFKASLPPDLDIEVIEESEHDVYLLLPQNPYVGIDESEIKKNLGLDLEDIAGWMLDQQKGLFSDERHRSVLLVANAWRDAEFKRKLQQEPKKILSEELGLCFLEDVAIHVLEEPIGKAYIVIPFLPDLTLAEPVADMHQVNLPIIIGSISPLPTDTFALDCTQTLTCPIGP